MISELLEAGVFVLRGVVPLRQIERLRVCADTCTFAPFSYSVAFSALLAAGCRPEDLSPPDVREYLDGVLGMRAALNPAHCWMRQRFAPALAPAFYKPNGWHQDGGLGVQFPAQASTMPEMVKLVTCWAPLQSCGFDSPGLEFVRSPLRRLLHYSELDDGLLRERFTPQDFWTPAMEPGDAAIFLNGTLHRTSVGPEMTGNRLSAEWRWFG